MFFVSFMAILWQGETIATSLDATTTGPLSKIFECRTFILIWNISLYSTLQNKSLHSFTEQYQRTRDNNNYCFCDDYSYCEERGHHPSPSPPLFISNRPVTPPAGCFEYRTQVRLTLSLRWDKLRYVAWIDLWQIRAGLAVQIRFHMTQIYFIYRLKLKN